MTDPHSNSQSLSEEQASLYVLGLMSEPDRRDFERQLRGDAELRGTLRGLESALESEVFGEPAPVAPARVWGKILERTRMDGAQVLLFPQPILRWAPRLAAMAAFLILGAVLHSWWSIDGMARIARVGGGREVPGLATGTGALGVPSGTSVDGAGEAPGPESALASGSAASRTGALSSVATTPAAGADRDEGLRALQALETENAELQGRIRGLNARIAELGQRIQQVTLIPSGVTRLHVFSLGQPGLAASLPTGSFDGLTRAPGGTDGPSTSLAQSLARLAGERMALALNTGSSGASTQEGIDRMAALGASGPGGAPGVEAVGKVALLPAQPAPSDFANAAAAPGIASIAGAPFVSGLDPSTSPTSPVSRIPGSVNPGAGTISPIVFSAPDSGVHAVAVPTAPAGGQYQLWSRAADGSVSSLGVLGATTSPVSVVTFERGSAEGLFMSLEPVGGSMQPTGPVVGSGQNPLLPGLGRP